MRLGILLMAMATMGCAMHAQTQGTPHFQSNLWASVDTDGHAEPPDFGSSNVSAVTDGRLWPPAVRAGVQVQAGQD